MSSAYGVSQFLKGSEESLLPLRSPAQYWPCFFFGVVANQNDCKILEIT